MPLVYNIVAICQDIERVLIWEKRLVFNKAYALTAKVARVSQRTPWMITLLLPWRSWRNPCDLSG